MPNKAELIKEQYKDPYSVLRAIERAATEGFDSLSEDELFMCKWMGLYTHRHEQGYLMLRTKHPNGCVTPEQLDVLAEIAEKKNKGFADITTRQDIQLHWVHYTQAAEILKELEAAGISTLGACGDVARNVVGCPVAGVDREEILDASSLAREVSDFFLGNPEYANLPRKLKIGISGCKTQCTNPEIQCVALVGRARKADNQDELGFDVRIGGGLSTQGFISQNLGVFIKPEEAIEVIKHITEIWRDSPEYREKRHRARFKYLVHDQTAERLRQTLEERLSRKLDLASADHQGPVGGYRDHVGVHAQKQAGLYYIGAPVLIGRITSQQMHKVADLCRRYGDGKTIRLTIRQNILLLNVPESNIERALAGLSEVGLSINAHPVRRSVVTCTGTEFCKLAITETKARSRQIVEYLEKHISLDEPIRLHITGCPNACAQYQIGNIGMMGSKTKVDDQIVDAYDFFVGGQVGHGACFNHAILRKVPATECARRLEHLFIGFSKQRKPKESFNAWCRRVGDEKLKDLLTGSNDHPLAGAEEIKAAEAQEKKESKESGSP